jgi:hypothetical protein
MVDVSRDDIEKYAAAVNECKKSAKCGAVKALAAGAEHAGVPAPVIQGGLSCVASRGGEACVKSGIKLAAIAGCTAVTGGSGALICSSVAGPVVDTAWPVVRGVLHGSLAAAQAAIFSMIPEDWRAVGVYDQDIPFDTIKPFMEGQLTKSAAVLDQTWYREVRKRWPPFAPIPAYNGRNRLMNWCWLNGWNTVLQVRGPGKIHSVLQPGYKAEWWLRADVAGVPERCNQDCQREYVAGLMELYEDRLRVLKRGLEFLLTQMPKEVLALQSTKVISSERIASTQRQATYPRPKPQPQTAIALPPSTFRNLMETQKAPQPDWKTIARYGGIALLIGLPIGLIASRVSSR